MELSSKKLEKAVNEMAQLPGIGKRTALRLVLHLLKQPKEQTQFLAEALQRGYLEHTDGFKLILPDFEKFKQLDAQLNKASKAFWELYREGKAQYLKHKDEPTPHITNTTAYLHYIHERQWISTYFKLKSNYFRLSLNAKIQSIAAHQTKRATVLLFNAIRDNNHLGIVKIINVIHDRFCRV